MFSDLVASKIFSVKSVESQSLVKKNWSHWRPQWLQHRALHVGVTTLLTLSVAF